MLVLQASPISIPWQEQEIEAGEVGQDTGKDPRLAACTPPPTEFKMSMPLYPFLPPCEAPIGLPPVSPGRHDDEHVHC